MALAYESITEREKDDQSEHKVGYLKCAWNWHGEKVPPENIPHREEHHEQKYSQAYFMHYFGYRGDISFQPPNSSR